MVSEDYEGGDDDGAKDGNNGGDDGTNGGGWEALDPDCVPVEDDPIWGGANGGSGGDDSPSLFMVLK